MSKPPMIYYMEVSLSYKKGRVVYNAEYWVISIYTTPAEIMGKARRAMGVLEERFYGKKYKSQKQIIIRKILSKKALTRVSKQAWDDRTKQS